MSGFVVPTFQSVAASWAVVDWTEPFHPGRPAAFGVSTITLEPLKPDEMWLIDHLVVQCDSGTLPSMALYADQVARSALLDGTENGNFGVAEYPSGLLVRPSTTLIAQWTNATDGAVPLLRLQARVMRQVST